MKNSYRVWVNGVPSDVDYDILDCWVNGIESYDKAWEKYMSLVAQGYDDVMVVNNYGKVVNRHNGFYEE